MFESLGDSLRSAVKTLRGKGKLTEANMRDGLQLVEQSLLEADVSYEVVQDFMAGVSERALGESVLKSLDPSEQVVGIVEQELLRILGEGDPSLHLKPDLTIIMLCGLQGSGKTTTCGKLTKMLVDSDVKPMLVAADLQRPAAIEQLRVLGQQLGVPVHTEDGAQDPVKVCQNAVKIAKKEGSKVVILDTAGRLAIDEELMRELSRIDHKVQPDQVYLVVDGMTGQDAVNSAKKFNESLELDGIIMTKLDGDARGGALLSVKHVTGVPLKFIGTGEHMESLEPFHPDGMVGRILGLGDIRALVTEAQKIVSEEEREETERKMREGEFTLEDFRDQMLKLAQPGLMGRLLGFMPGMGDIKKMMDGEDTESDMQRMVGIINSMTPAERRAPKIIDPSRRSRIAMGAGVQTQEVNQLCKQFEMMKPLMQSMAGQGMAGRMKAIQEMQSSGMLDPGGAGGPRLKKGTGKRLSPAEKLKARKEREKKQRQMKRKKKGK